MNRHRKGKPAPDATREEQVEQKRDEDAERRRIQGDPAYGDVVDEDYERGLYSGGKASEEERGSEASGHGKRRPPKRNHGHD